MPHLGASMPQALAPLMLTKPPLRPLVDHARELAGLHHAGDERERERH